MKKFVTNALVVLTILPLINSCGKKSSGNGASGNCPGPVPTEEQIEEEGSVDGSTIDGQYKASFVTLNSQVNGTIPGSLTLFRDGDKLLTYLRLFAGKPKAWHPQGIYRGDRCPDLGDDKNNDGYIDIEEALTVVGDMIVPLDASMNSQAAGKNFYPLADLSGYYHYEREASFNALFEDLRKEDKDPNDHIGKLAVDEKFAFQGRVVMVQGIDEATMLPASVMSNGRRRAFQTLPVSCGIIAKVTAAPGLPYDGEIPGSVAPVVDDQDRPAPADDNTTGTSIGGTVAGTTGTNDTNDGEVGDEGGSEDGTTGGETTGGTVGGTAGGTTGGTVGSTVGGSTGGGTSGGSQTGGSTTGDTTTGGSTTGGTTTGGTTGGSTGGRSSGGFIGGFIGGSDDGDDDSSRRSRRSSRRSRRIFPD